MLSTYQTKSRDVFTSAIHDLKKEMRNTVLSIIPLQNISDKDVDLIAQLCAMASVPTGEENPHMILRSISCETMDEAMKNFSGVQCSPLLASVSQFFFIEWCYRNDYLTADWKWQWDSHDEGHVTYQSMRPLENILSGADAC